MAIDSITVKEISYYSGNGEICLKGQVWQAQFNYETTVYITPTQLNRIINHLQLQNDSIEVAGEFSACIDNEGNSFMWLTTAHLEHSTISWELLRNEENLLRIRA
jgi:hypothetical protein